MTYGWREGVVAPKQGSPEDLNKQLCAIRAAKKREVLAKDVVEANRSKTAPFHRYFEWNDARCGEKYREEQARHLIKMLVFSPTENPESKIRAFVSVKDPNRARFGTGFTPMLVALSKEASRTQLLAQALSELRAFETKYSALRELSSVITAARRVLRKAQKVRQKKL